MSRVELRDLAARRRPAISCSVAASTAVVGSCRISTGAPAAYALASAIRWRCPPESLAPPSPTAVSKSSAWCGATSTSDLHLSAPSRSGETPSKATRPCAWESSPDQPGFGARGTGFVRAVGWALQGSSGHGCFG